MSATPRTDAVYDECFTLGHPTSLLAARLQVHAERLEMELGAMRDALVKAHIQVNHPAKAGKVWATYPREQMDTLINEIRAALAQTQEVKP